MDKSSIHDVVGWEVQLNSQIQKMLRDFFNGKNVCGSSVRKFGETAGGGPRSLKEIQKFPCKISPVFHIPKPAWCGYSSLWARAMKKENFLR
ncbi:hypothetical protein TNIN_411801 [Trichonephila inaurata madagascariensis]|uniref:Uncharacterized protein n=1 Tax=Trichonephila inaurata madagascariensis TaxID=2747483 RepID=A0A8X6YCU7_9ARAC|nr:hypothetical protein TNIN_411801 [Trichonephila inaurata madagascariensis]